MLKHAALVLMLVLTAACAETAPTDVQVDTIEIGDGPADNLAQLRVRADGMTVWAEPRALSLNDWLFQGRSSHTLAAIYASVDGDEARAELISARKFEVSLTATQMETNLGGAPLLVRLETASGKTYHVMFGSRARFVDTTGSSKIYPWRNIEPVAVGRDRVFRGRITTRGEFDFVAGWNDDDSEPVPTQTDATHWNLDWYPGMLAWAAHPTEDALELVGDMNGKRYRRNAPIHMQVTQLGVTNGDPANAWPAATCEATVEACMASFDVDTDDMESCGSWAEVAPCFDRFAYDDTPEWVRRFASDLRRTVIDHYRVHEQDIIASGGNTRPQALLSVDSADIQEVTAQDDVPSGHDLSTHRVFTHPDITFPGSDTVWYGVYDRATGARVEVSSFN